MFPSFYEGDSRCGHEDLDCDPALAPQVWFMPGLLPVFLADSPKGCAAFSFWRSEGSEGSVCARNATETKLILVNVVIVTFASSKPLQIY